MPPENESPLERLNKRVYQQQPESELGVPAYTHEDQPATYGWQAPTPIPAKKGMPLTVKFLIGAIAFLVFAALVAAFLIFRGTRAVSSDNVQIQVQSPVSIASGDTISLVITVHNSNPAALNDATIFATLPDGTRTGDEAAAPFPQYSEPLGKIPAGGDVTRTMQVKLFGTQGQTLTIPFKVQYHTDGSNALYVSEEEYPVTIATSPISVQVQALSQTPSNQPFTLMVTVRSNASAPVPDVALLATYPPGFTVRSTEPTTSGTNFFALGTLAPSEQKILKVTGILVGQNAEQRVFRFTAGSANSDGTNTLGNPYAEGDASIAITHPFLDVGLTLNRVEGDSITTQPGDSVSGFLTWKNTLTDTLTNASVRVMLSGNALDTATIAGGTGFYRSSDNTIIFDSTTNPALASLRAGDTGAGSFSFSVKQAAALAGLKNPTVTLTVAVSGQQASQGNASQVLNSTLTRTVKIGTTVTTSSTLARVSGAVPPKVGAETVYDVTLSAKNTVNSVGAAKETFLLPSYIRFTGVADAGVTYNADTHMVTWSIGDLNPNATATAHFQIGLTPSSSQAGSVPVLVQEQTFTGVDRSTGALQATTPALTTELPGVRGSGTVE